MTPFQLDQTRRHFFASSGLSLGSAALYGLLAGDARAADAAKTGHAAALPTTHFPPKAKRVIYLHMVGGPSQMDLYDYKPLMNWWYNKDLPDAVRKGQRL